MHTTRLDKCLLSEGLVTHQQIEEARQRTLGSKRPLQDELVDMGFITEDQIVEFFLTMDDSIETVDLSAVPSDPEVIELVPYDITQKHGLIPIRIEDAVLLCAMSNPFNIIAKDDIRQITGLNIKPLVVTRTDILDAVKKRYNLNEWIYDVYKNLSGDDKVTVLRDDEQGQESEKELERNAKMVPIIKLVNMTITDAVKTRASDIHLEPKTDEVELRYRVDGVLRKIMSVPTNLFPAIVSRIKIISELNIAERRKPQDGRAKIELNGKEIDLRVSVLPTFLGEKVVIRILDTATSGSDLDESIGFTPKELSIYRNFIEQPQGMILITGPTGSGKTTTLYSSLKHLNDDSKNITTVENPVEYQLDGINQIQINEAAGITFATSLRSILRQDPNVVLVGEIRDLETAEIAFQASQTGHLVLSTLHTNNTISTITRLVDIGVEHYLIASSVIGIVAQRLIRKLCPTCRQPYQPDQEKLASLGIAPGQHQFYKEQGCGQCGFTGFSGRTAIFEILEVGEETKNLISSRRPENEIFDGARAGGMRLLAEVGIEKAKAGVTSLEEVQRVASFGELTDIYCPQCNNRITKEFSTCPYCSYKLMQLYPNCSQKINSNWNTCPYCGSGVSTPHKHQAPPVAPTPKQELPVVPATPQQDQRSEHTPHSGHHENPAGNHFKLLAVDDDPNVRQIIRATFRNDFHVIEAVDGIEGLEKAHKESPDIMIVDVMMPNMSGFELCRHLRSNLATGSIPIVMLTAKTDLKSEAEGLDAGADDYLTKPFEPQRLALRVKALLSRHHQHFASATQ